MRHYLFYYACIVALGLGAYELIQWRKRRKSDALRDGVA